ncbi:hypothetical protein [Pleionea sediminis]|uniref:hypothetical protein n=1 Tax=Pleionea sediminis TaxID=2569479 RepID=UPI0011859EC3|nr:hypothetical protein [Pleionea sediminis]
MTIKTNIKNNMLSLISLTVALTALFYNTWRNEKTELNRNYRESGFEIIREVAQLQLLVDNIHYTKGTSEREPITGWTRVNFILSLSQIMPSTVARESRELKEVWAEHWDTLEQDKNSNKLITQANKELELAVLDVLKALD